MSELLSMATSVHARYLWPFVAGLMMILLSDSIIQLIFTSFGSDVRRTRR